MSSERELKRIALTRVELQTATSCGATAQKSIFVILKLCLVTLAFCVVSEHGVYH
jgi:hypothetical protein